MRLIQSFCHPCFSNDVPLDQLFAGAFRIGYQCDRTAWGVAVCHAVNSPSVKLLYDIYHMQIMEGDVIRTIRENIQWIGHFHTAGNPGRGDLDEAQELNYRAIISAITATGFEGFIAHEFHPKGDPITALRDAFEICGGYEY